MSKRPKLIGRLASFGSTALLLASIGSTALLWSASLAADQAAGPQVSATVAKPLKAAQDAMREKKPDEALAKTKEAQAASGEKSGYDNFVINVLLFQIYQQKQDMGAAIPMLSQAAQSQYASAEQQRSWLKNIALYKAVASITKGIAKGGLKSPEEANVLLGIAQLRMKNAGEAQRAFVKAAASRNGAYIQLGRLWALHAGAHDV